MPLTQKKNKENSPSLQPQQLLHDLIILHQHDPILLLRPVPVERPSGRDRFLVERAQEGLFDVIGDGHVVFDGVEAAEDDVEEADLGRGAISRGLKGMWKR